MVKIFYDRNTGTKLEGFSSTVPVPSRLADSPYIMKDDTEWDNVQQGFINTVVNGELVSTPILPTVAELWQAAEDYYTGAGKPEASRLSKSETDAYQLGQVNYQRQAAGKPLIGTAVINPDNPRLLENLAWGQSIWTEYYIRKAMLEAGQMVSTDFSAGGDKPWSFAEVVAAENMN